jgi:hypothetical protein
MCRATSVRLADFVVSSVNLAEGLVNRDPVGCVVLISPMVAQVEHDRDMRRQNQMKTVEVAKIGLGLEDQLLVCEDYRASGVQVVRPRKAPGWTS